MSIQSIKEKIEKLRDLLNHHNYLYYVLDTPSISDFEFDSLMNELIDLETKHPKFFDSLSPTNRVGGGVVMDFKTVLHQLPMLSLSNTYSKEEVEEFDIRIKNTLKKDLVYYTSELKYDGVAISLIYENGLFKQGITRGDGIYGDDVSENIKTIKSIPLKLFGMPPKLLELRGEIFINKKDFDALNLSRSKKREKLLVEYENKKSRVDVEDFEKIKKHFHAEYKKLANYSNPRNLASGTLKLLDSAKVAKRNLNCMIYSVHGSELPFDSHYHNLLESRKWGFRISEQIKLNKSVDEIMKFISDSEFMRDSLPFEIDGVVIKVNNLNSQNILSHTSKFPRWAISYKFKSPQAITVLNNIQYQVGRTGNITPVADLEPVYLAGSLISKATLHNQDFIHKMDLKIGDSVFIEKGGDVIPKVISVDLKKRNHLCEDIIFITNCPSCGSQLSKPLYEVNHYCLNNDCLPKKIGQVEHFISRDAMNIQTLGIKTITLLFEEGLIQNIADLYVLQLDQLTSLKGFGEKSQSIKKAKNIIESIHKSKNTPFTKVLYGLGIRYVGKTVSKKIANYFGSVSHIMTSSLETLLEVDEVGEKIANSVFIYFRDIQNQVILDRLMNYGLNFSVEYENIESDKLKKIIFVVSGTFTISREEIKDLIEKNGGKNSTSLSKKTHYLIAGKNMGSKKRELALNLKIPIISEIDLKNMLK